MSYESHANDPSLAAFQIKIARGVRFIFAAYATFRCLPDGSFRKAGTIDQCYLRNRFRNGMSVVVDFSNNNFYIFC